MPWNDIMLFNTLSLTQDGRYIADDIIYIHVVNKISYPDLFSVLDTKETETTRIYNTLTRVM